MSALLRQQMMMMAQAAAAKVSLVGTCGLNGSLNTVQYTLPAGALANNVVVCGFAFNSASGNTLTPPANAVPLVNGVSTSNMQAYMYRIPLTATDVTNGYVEFGWAGSQTAFIPGAVFRDVSISQPLDGTVSQGLQPAPIALPFSATAPEITTTTPGAVLIQFAAMTPTSADGGMVMGVPSGWTNLNTQAPLQIDATMNYLAQTSRGETGSISSACTGSAGTQASWGAWLFALRPTTPAITLSATFPSSPHVGDAISFDVTAMLVDGATGTPTITVDQLPAGLSLGSTSMVDATHYKATVSGTLTTAQDITGTFGTTGGSPNATPLAHEFNVTAAPTGPVRVETVTYNPNTNTSGPWPLILTDVKVGDQIVVAAIANAGSRRALTFSDSSENTYTKSATSGSTSLGTQINTALATAETAADSLTVSVASSGNAYPSIVVYHLRGSALTLDTVHFLAPSMSASPATIGPYSSAKAFWVVPIYSGNGNAGAISTTASGYTTDLAAPTRGSTAYVTFLSKIAAAATSGESFTASSAAPDLYWTVSPFNY